MQGDMYSKAGGGAPAPAQGEAPAAPAQGAGGPSMSGMNGMNPDAMRQEIMSLLEQKGVFESASSETEKAELLALIDELVEAMQNGDQAAIQSSPIMQMLASEPSGEQQMAPASQAPMGGGMPQGGGGMMPPGGGGMMNG